MIREVHIYGNAAQIVHDNMDAEKTQAQHTGLGKKLILKAEEIAARRGYAHIRVISAIGTRNYYRKLGFADSGLYQIKVL